MNTDTGQISADPETVRRWGEALRAIPLTDAEAERLKRLRRADRLVAMKDELPPAGLTREERNIWLREHGRY